MSSSARPGSSGSFPSAPDRILFVKSKKDHTGTDNDVTHPVDPNFWAGNSVYTTKYTPLSFLPKFLWYQFNKAPNIFFLAIAVLQQIPGVSPTSRFSTIIPLFFILSVSAVKEIIEDRKRREADELANHSKTRIYDQNLAAEGNTDPFKRGTWSEVRVGDLVRIKQGESFPADLVFLASSDSSGICFVETANIDGETNLKIKEALGLDWKEGMTVSFEQPSEQIYQFRGKLTLASDTRPLSITNLLLRGSALRNTDWIIGLVIYTGVETRIMKNSAASSPIKQARLDSEINYHMTLMLIVLIVMVLASFGWWAYGSLLGSTKRMPHLKFVLSSEFGLKALIYRFFTYIVLYHSIIPISLLVTMEICRFHLARLINSDLVFFQPEEEDEEPITEGVKVANSNIVDDLGQVKYVLSDKTGTLTLNKMTLEKISDAHGHIYDMCDRVELTEDLLDLLEAMGICHTVMIEGAGRSSLVDIRKPVAAGIVYQASSPDELAIVKGCDGLGFKFVDRQVGRMTLLHPEGARRTYNILHLIEFSSERKRMSLVVSREGSQTVSIYTKGADDMILSLLSPRSRQFHSSLERVVGSFAKDGLRTLVFAKRDMSLSDWVQWKEAHLTDPKGYDLLERELELLGVTAVEDKLAPGVPETIDLLQQASIRVWILTGDRLETALNVAVSSKLHQPDHQQLILADPSEIDTLSRGVGNTCAKKFDLVVEGRTLDRILADEAVKEKFIRLAMGCATVLCCRTSPLQKRVLTEALMRVSGQLCLTIGDGANDVGMIQAANVGVGIAGKEGRQAARSADIAIPRFSHLSRLLLVHGSWSYMRLAKTIIYCSYKNLLLVTSQFWYAAFCGASGQTVFESWMLTLSNALFTSYIPIAIGVTDQHITARLLLEHPRLYKMGQSNAALTVPRFWKAAVNAVLQTGALLLLTTVMIGGDPMLPDGSNGGMWVFSSTYYCCALLTLIYKAAIITNSWNLYMIATLVFGIVSWFGYVVISDILNRLLGNTGFTLIGLTPILFSYMPFWLVILLAPLAVLLRDFLWKYVKRLYRPREYHIVQELEMLSRKTSSKVPPADEPVESDDIYKLQAQQMSVSSFSQHIRGQPRHHDGFAFSQTRGQTSLISHQQP